MLTDRFMWLVIIAVLNSVVSVYYYLKVVVHIYMHEGSQETPLLRSRTLVAAFAITVILTLQVGVFPGRYLKMVGEAVRDLAASVKAAPQTTSADGDNQEKAQLRDVLTVADSTR